MYNIWMLFLLAPGKPQSSVGNHACFGKITDNFCQRLETQHVRKSNWMSRVLAVRRCNPLVGTTRGRVSTAHLFQMRM